MQWCISLVFKTNFKKYMRLYKRNFIKINIMKLIELAKIKSANVELETINILYIFF